MEHLDAKEKELLKEGFYDELYLHMSSLCLSIEAHHWLNTQAGDMDSDRERALINAVMFTYVKFFLGDPFA